MDSDSTSNPPPSSAQHQKRSRILLSCAPCRNSKLKCDRDQPCGQCAKKGRLDLCTYAPKPDRSKRKAARGGMSARLKRLEGMVRGMMDEEGTRNTEESERVSAQPPVVMKQDATTYVGATHCMAMLEDIEDLKGYFDAADEDDEEDGPTDEIDAQELLLLQRRSPVNRHDLLTQLPDRKIADRLITRYFTSMSPSQHIVHRQKFTREYTRFWLDFDTASLHWIAQFFMMLALGVFFNAHQAPHEVEGDSPLAPIDRIKHYKSCAGWALVLGKFTQPTPATLPAFLLYVESFFLFNRAGQMNCYVLSGVNIRLMLKMGLHRDPSKLANITPFEGEMRRRMWNMAIQVESLVAFHMGLPSMFQNIESDVEVPRNLQDEDFDEDCTELPPSRPTSDYTAMTYPIHKTNIVRGFGKVARQAHALSPPSYSEVLKLDQELQDVYASIPSFMKVKNLDECVGDSPTLLMQRFGIAALYFKSVCVLHRRYLSEAVPKSEHDYSRQQCLKGALTLMNYQAIIWEACKPGNVLSQNEWFVSSLAVHDYLFAAMVLYMLIQNENYVESGPGWEWTSETVPKPSKEELIQIIRKSYEVWADVSNDILELKKTASTLALMLAKLGVSVDNSPSTDAGRSATGLTASSGKASTGSSDLPLSTTAGTYGDNSDLLSSLGMSEGPNGHSTTATPFVPTTETMSSMDFPSFGTTNGNVPMGFELDSAWMSNENNVDWRFLDISLAHSHTAGANMAGPGPVWTDKVPLDDMDYMASGSWDQGANIGP